MKKGFIPFETPSRKLDKLSNTTLLCRKKSQTGFTLLEILLIVGIIAILAGIVILAINPTKMLSQTRNVQRKANLSELNKALYQYYIDNNRYPTSVTTTLTEICDTEATSTGHSLNCTNKIDLSPLVPVYLTAIPTDPQATGTSTGYLVAKNTANKIHLKADNAELSQTTTIGDMTGVLPDHLVSYWSFDGNANDSWGTNHGTIVGATATTGVKGLASTAYAFDGADDLINIADSSNLKFGANNFSVSFWFKTISFVGWSGFVNKGVLWSGDQNWLIRTNTNGNQIIFDSYVSGSRTTWGFSTYTISLNTWTHAVVIINPFNTTTSASLYINGNFISTISQNTVVNFNSTQNMWFGRADAGNMFNGSMDNIRVYNKALTANEVLNIYNTEKP